MEVSTLFQRFGKKNRRILQHEPLLLRDREQPGESRRQQSFQRGSKAQGLTDNFAKVRTLLNVNEQSRHLCKVCVMADNVFGIQHTHAVGDEGAPVPSLRVEALVAQTLHQLLE